MTNPKTIDWYNKHAQDYTDHVRNPDDSIYHAYYEKPAMYALLPDLEGKRVLSIGCGSGDDAHYLQHRGANVVGIDISSGLIDIARQSYPECEFSVMDMQQLVFEDCYFDFIYSSLALHYLEDWTNALSEAYRVLKPGAHFLFSCGHPTYSAMQTVQDDDITKMQVLSRTVDRKTNSVEIVGDYFTRRSMEINDWVTWHKPICEISSEVTGAGFLIAGIHEPKPLEKMSVIAPKDYKTLMKLPNFLIIDSVRPS